MAARTAGFEPFFAPFAVSDHAGFFDTRLRRIAPATFVSWQFGAAMIVIETFARGQPIRAPPLLRSRA
jgi:hypothetical protein